MLRFCLISVLALFFFVSAVGHTNAQEFAWQDPKATVLPTGGIAWKPDPFVYRPGQTVRYIDFADGDDDSDGRTPDTAWKHHPWDAAARGRAAASVGSGIDTYVFRRGVTYRGQLTVNEQGQPDRPIRLTSDPAWGGADAQAVLSGARRVSGWRPLSEVEATGGDDSSTHTTALGRWGSVTHPAEVAEGEAFEVTVHLPETIEGQKLCVSLNWVKKAGGFGGFNTVSRPNQIDAVAGDHTVKIKPRPKPGLGGYVLTVYLSPDGGWKNRTEAANADVPLPGNATPRADVRSAVPDVSRVWVAELDFAPRNVWMVGKNGAVTRIPLARSPNWTVQSEDDVKSQWYVFDNPGNPHFKRVKVGDKERFLGIDTEHLTREPAYYDGAYVWTEYGWVMGTPYPSRIVKYFPEQNGIAIEGQWGGTAGSRHLPRYSRYYLEDKPHYLDDPAGEFWFERQGTGGRLYLIPPDGQDPNTLRIEAGRDSTLIDAAEARHLVISGLTFRFTNTWWDLDAAPFAHPDVDPACIRLLGPGEGLTVAHNVFEHVNLPVRMAPTGDGATLDRVVIRDNVMRHTDHGGIALTDGSNWGEAQPTTRLLDVKVLRNKLEHIGLRPTRWGQGHAIDILCAQTCEVAGNVLDRLWGTGIFVYGAKRSAARTDRPLSRILIHHNQVTNSMLNTNDWGGIETWQGGPAYVFNNVSGNPGGYKMWGHRNQPDVPGSARFGHAFYMDGGFKQYYFNNIAWGKSSDPFSPLGNTAAFQEIHGYLCNIFNNTAYNFVVGSRRQAPQAGKNKYLGNIWHSMGHMVFRHARPSNQQADPNAADAGSRHSDYEHATNAYADNVFYRPPEQVAVFEPGGQWYGSVPHFAEALRQRGSIGDVGQVVDHTPLAAPGLFDFRPTAAARDKGVRVFVPWGLAGVVGEWHFYHAGDDATRVPDDHWQMSPYYVNREDYHNQPRYPLTVVNGKPRDFVAGPLENWTRGALRLNGRDQYAVLPAERLHAEAKTPHVALNNKPSHWVRFEAPDRIVPGQPTTIKLHLEGVPDGMQLRADLHWVRTNGRGGGVNVASKQPLKVDGPGPYAFTLTPQDKVRLGHFVIVAWYGPTDAWKDKVELARFAVPRGVAVPEGGYRSPNVGRENLLIEAYVKPDALGDPAVLVNSMPANTGYTLELDAAGHVLFTIAGESERAQVRSTRPLKAGQWTHVLVEADRGSRTMRVYLDGQLDQSGGGLGPVSLAHGSDITVGGTPAGRCFAGQIEFLRIARGTLADAQTTIQELDAWQFDGPFLRDFTGRAPVGRRDAGAIEEER